MTEIDTLTEFLGWCSVINVGIFIFSAIAVTILRDPIASIHSRLFRLNKSDLPEIYVHYLGVYKIAVIIFNLVPYIALKAMS